MQEYVEIQGYKHTNKGTELYVVVPNKTLGPYLGRFSKKGIVQAELRLDDGRTISADQRKKIYATIRDIADYTGYIPEELKEYMKYYYMIENDEEYFSLSDCSITTARLFLNYLIEFALGYRIPLKNTGLERTDDIDTYLYMCIKYKRCALCGSDAEIHHWDAIGMGRDRRIYNDSKHRKIALCRTHHSEAHTIGRDRFGKKHHVYGIIYKEDKEH